MILNSMTGFARQEGANGDYRWSWEVKTVNSKGLDIRLRLPPGLDAMEASARAAVSAVFFRGSCQIGLSLKREGAAVTVRINQAVLDAVIQAMAHAAKRLDAAPPRLDGLLAIKGVLETDETQEASHLSPLHAPLLADLERAITSCAAMRKSEGLALGAVLMERIAEIEALTREADANPARRPEAMRDRLAQQIRQLHDAAPALNGDRLYQEAVLLAAKADIREELDRLGAHVSAARDLLKTGGPVGRKLDFLAQEFNREANTLCSKSNDVSLTATGLALKAVVEQFREQVQNIE